jgi:hypothetical protein
VAGDGRLARFTRWATAHDNEPNADCPVCGRRIRAAPNSYVSRFGHFRIPRMPEELVRNCRTQHGSDCDARSVRDREEPAAPGTAEESRRFHRRLTKIEAWLAEQRRARGSK